MSKLIDGVKHYTAKEITELCGVTSSAFNNAVYRHGLVRVMHDGHWHYPQSSVDAYRQTCKTKHTAPLQSQSAPTELPPTALQSLDPLESEEEAELANNDDVRFTAEKLSVLADEEPGPAKNMRERYDERFANPEIAMFNLVMSQLRRQVSSECKGNFIAELKGFRDTVVTLIDVIIAEYEASTD